MCIRDSVRAERNILKEPAAHPILSDSLATRSLRLLATAARSMGLISPATRSKGQLGTNRSPCDIGLKYERPAIKKFMERRGLGMTNGFAPPYVKAAVEYSPPTASGTSQSRRSFSLGGEGDYVFQSGDQFCLLEIKCLVSRKITKKIPIHYYLQIQTMLYVYYVLNIPIGSAIYCENVFDIGDENGDEGKSKLLEFWECNVDLDKTYFENKIIPILGEYSKHLHACKENARATVNATEGPPMARKRTRETTTDDQPASYFFNKRRKLNNGLVERLNFSRVFSHYLGQTNVYSSGCFSNFLNGNCLRDLYYIDKNNKNDKTYGIKSNDKLTLYSSPKVDIDDLRRRLQISGICTDGDKPLTCIDVDQRLMPKDDYVDSQTEGSNQFIVAKYLEMMRVFHLKPDIIKGGQLYSPYHKIWINIDYLLKNTLLKDIGVEVDDKSLSPNRYTPVLFIPVNFNLNNKTSQRARFLLYLQMTVLNFYFSRRQYIGLIVGVDNKITKVDFGLEHRHVEKKYKLALEWLDTLADVSTTTATATESTDVDNGQAEPRELSVLTTDLKISDGGDVSAKQMVSKFLNLQTDSESSSTLANFNILPNCKVKTRDERFEQWKTRLVNATGELTQLWSISGLKRDKLAKPPLNIDSIEKLAQNINKKAVKTILSSSYENIRNMLLATRTGKIVGLRPVRRELRSLKREREIFLDLEFTPTTIYLIGYVYKSGDGTTKNNGKNKDKAIAAESEDKIEMCQHVLENMGEDQMEGLLHKFASHVRAISQESKDIVNCYHWGEVEERLIKKHLPDLYNNLNFIDVHSILVDLHFAIPNCNSYSIKEVARALKRAGHIQTEWTESVDGYWCNQVLSKLLDSNDPDSNDLKDIPKFQKIIEYNRTDCQVLYEIVKFLIG